jgi:putative ubiquitin-RnfH superfamily antitoxin RatB of RatAB toxin-antitoxin module
MDPGELNVEVVYSPKAGDTRQLRLTLDPGATVRDAIARCGLLDEFPDLPEALANAEVSVGIWGCMKSMDDPLRDQDRVEIYRPLKVDPKEARRLRYGTHRQQTAAKKTAKR